VTVTTPAPGDPGWKPEMTFEPEVIVGEVSKFPTALVAIAAVGIGAYLMFARRSAPSMAGLGMLGHPGMLNKRGCHLNRKTGRVHCHRPSGWKKRRR
jgi:hypothetical protein